ncbi:unnamed protein product, partial [Mesorhabditis spiculigera]
MPRARALKVVNCYREYGPACNWYQFWLSDWLEVAAVWTHFCIFPMFYAVTLIAGMISYTCIPLGYQLSRVVQVPIVAFFTEVTMFYLGFESLCEFIAMAVTTSQFGGNLYDRELHSTFRFCWYGFATLNTFPSFYFVIRSLRRARQLVAE